MIENGGRRNQKRILIKQRLRQGSPLKPVLFNLYLGHVIREQQDSNLHQTNILATILLADDQVIMTASEASLRKVKHKLSKTTSAHVNRVSSCSIVSDNRLDDRAIGVRSPAGAKDFSSSLCVQTGSGAHPASCTMGTEGPFPGAKARPGRNADHSPPSSAEVEYVKELYLLSSQAPSWLVVGQL
jgi:hypothetical protein